MNINLFGEWGRGSFSLSVYYKRPRTGIRAQVQTRTRTQMGNTHTRFEEGGDWTVTQGNIDILTILFLCITTYIYLERDDAVGPALFHQVNV